MRIKPGYVPKEEIKAYVPQKKRELLELHADNTVPGDDRPRTLAPLSALVRLLGVRISKNGIHRHYKDLAEEEKKRIKREKKKAAKQAKKAGEPEEDEESAKSVPIFQSILFFD